MVKSRINKVKLVKKLSRQIKIPRSKVISSRKKNEQRRNWKQELKRELEDK